MKKPILYGIFTAIALIAYFMLMKILGQEKNFYLRFFNFFIIIGGTYFLLKELFISNNEGASYFEGLGAGLIMNVTAVLIFLGFLGVYTTVFDPDFIRIMESARIWGNDLNIIESSFAIFIEGMASGVVISFAWMQHFKKFIAKEAAI